MAHGKSPKHARKKRKGAARTRPTRGDAQSRPSRARTSAPPDVTETPSPETRPDVARAKPPGVGPMRLQKLLAAAGFGSRRDVERFLLDERVSVNGRTAQLGDRADPAVDEIRVDGERLARERPSYWLLNKPRGIITTVRDDEGRRTVMDLLPPGAGRLFPVGRLDRETSGLLLLTNDGDTAHVLLHPSLGNEREYRVTVKGQLDERAVTRLERGVPLEEGRTAPSRVAAVRFDSDAGSTSFLLTLVEGRKRQIRRSLLMLGFPVRRLVRIRMGPLRLGRLAVGEARPLRAEERRALLAHAAVLRGEPARPPAGPRAPRAHAKPRASEPTKVKRGVDPKTPRPGRRAARPAAEKPARRGAAKSAGRSTAKPAKRGAAKPAGRGAGKPARRGAAKSAGRSTAKSAKRSAAKPAKRPAKRAAKKGARKTGARAAGKSAGRRPDGRGPQRAARSRKGVKR